MESEEMLFEIADKAGITILDLQTAARQAWADISVPGTTAHAQAVAHGLDPDALPPKLNEVVKLRAAQAGMGTVDVALSLYLGKVGWDVWHYVLLPHIREKWGDNAIRAKKAAAKRAIKADAGVPAAKKAAVRRATSATKKDGQSQ